MAVVADRAAGLQPPAHNLVLSVVISAEHRVALATFELRVSHLLNLVEIYFHVGKSFLLFSCFAKSRKSYKLLHFADSYVSPPEAELIYKIYRFLPAGQGVY